MNVIDAAHKTVHDYPGGSESLGPRIGMSPAVLRNKVNPNCQSHHLTLKEADEVMAITEDFRILQALAAHRGFVLQPVDKSETPGSIISTVLALGMCEGDFARTLHDALADGAISDREMNDIANASHAVQSTMIRLLGCLSAARQGRATL